MFAGLTNHGNSPLTITTSTNVNINTLAYYAVKPESDWKFIVSDTASWPFDDTYALWKSGTFDASKFPHCGDAICDGGETTATCAADCK